MHDQWVGPSCETTPAATVPRAPRRGVRTQRLSQLVHRHDRAYVPVAGHGMTRVRAPGRRLDCGRKAAGGRLVPSWPRKS